MSDIIPSLKALGGAIASAPEDLFVEAQTVTKAKYAVVNGLNTVGRGLSHLFELGTVNQSSTDNFKTIAKNSSAKQDILAGFHIARSGNVRIGAETLVHTRVSSAAAFILNLTFIPAILNIALKVVKAALHTLQAIGLALATAYYAVRGKDEEKILAKTSALIKLGMIAGDLTGVLTEVGRSVYLIGKYAAGIINPAIASHHEEESFQDQIGIAYKYPSIVVLNGSENDNPKKADEAQPEILPQVVSKVPTLHPRRPQTNSAPNASHTLSPADAAEPRRVRKHRHQKSA